MSKEQVELFDMAVRQAEMAWTGTSMLARTQQSKADMLVQLYANATDKDIAATLADMAGPSFASVSMTGGADAQRASELAASILEMALEKVVDDRVGARAGHAGAQGDLASALYAIEQHLTVVRAWVEDGAHPAAPDLQKVNTLIGGRAATRLSLVAPAAPALAICGLVIRAVQSGYPFRGCTPSHAPAARLTPETLQ